MDAYFMFINKKLRKPSKTASLHSVLGKSSDMEKSTATASSLNSLNHTKNMTNITATTSTSFGHGGFSGFWHNRSKISKASSKSGANTSKKSSVSITKPIPTLPDSLLIRCIEELENPFEIFKLQRLTNAVFNHYQRKLQQIIEMDVRKCAIIEQNNETGNNKYWMQGDSQPWFRHPGVGGHKILMRFVSIGNESTRVEILVDDCWSSRDVFRLCRILNRFRTPLKHIHMDAAIIELVIASLSIMDLDRWYAFQCYMKAVNDYQIHLAIDHLEKTKHVDPSNLYWPNVETLIVMDRRRLDALKIILTDVDRPTRTVIRNLYHFRCWAGSAGFDDRFSQQYFVNVV